VTAAETSLIVDATYRCNARCHYCRWGDGSTGERRDAEVAELCVPVELLRAAGITRVVVSGGEPLLHPGLSDVLSHYRSTGVSQRVVITNGLLASAGRLSGARAAGATGFAFSLDAAEATAALATRAFSPAQLAVALAHLADAGRLAEKLRFELTVNCVLSAANCDVGVLRDLAVVVTERGATALKFQPIFDDGYLGQNAAHLRLEHRHAEVIRRIGVEAATWPIPVNPAGFFEDLAAHCEGRRLAGPSCGLGRRTFVLRAGRLVVCPWVGTTGADSVAGIAALVADFDAVTVSCGTGAHCFCLQPTGHRWRFDDALR